MIVEVEGAEELAAHLDHVAERIHEEDRQVVAKGALNVKTAWRAAWTGIEHPPTHIPHLAAAVTYDLDDKAGDWVAEVGPDKALPQGPLGNLLEFGSVHNAPRPGGQPALDAEEPRFVDAVADLAHRLLEG